MPMRVSTLGVVVIFVVATMSHDTDAADAWLRDTNSGCAVWNPDPRNNESFSWSGSCLAGLATGEGVLQWYEDGKQSERYEGVMSGGKPHGLGTVTLSTGETHQAQSIDGIFNGPGKVSWSDGVYCKVTYVDGVVDGQAFCYHPNGDVTAHLFEQGKPIRRQPEQILADEN